MSERRSRFWPLVLFMVLAQVAINVPVWSVAGQTSSSHLSLAAIGAVSIAAFSYFAARIGGAGQEGSVYFRFLLGSFLFTAAEAASIIFFSPPGTPGESHQFRWTELIIGLIVAAVLFMVVAIYISDTATSYLLDILSERVQRVSPRFGLPGPDLGAGEIRNAIPSVYPPGDLGPRGRQTQRDEQREFRGAPGSAELLEDLARGTAWAQALLAENSRSRLATSGPIPVMTSVGFVQSPSEGVELAIINYYLPGPFLQALLTMPRSITFAGESFPVVARPWLPEEGEHDGHCWVTFGEGNERHGVVTARHLIAPKTAAIGSKVSARTSRGKITGTLHKESVAMDAALIELTDEPKRRLAAVPHSKVPGYKPIRLYTDGNWVDGYVIEMSGFVDGFYEKNPDGEPAPAQMILNVTGKPGDSGSLVLDVAGEESGRAVPYLMYRGTVRLAPGRGGQAGRCIFLDQIAYHWNVNFQFRIPSDSNPAAPTREEDDLR